MANQIGITKGLYSWQFQNSYVERTMDDSAYEAAHPDDTLVLAGPARLGSVPVSGSTGASSLLAIGMLQSISFTQTKPTQPLMAIGSGRSFFVSGKSQTQWSIARLFINGRNLLRVLYHNFVGGGGDPSMFDDRAAYRNNSAFFINLDSELYYIPFGMGVIVRNKAHSLVGSFYTELCMINSYAMAVNSGQNMILENVTGLADRMLPWMATDSAATTWGMQRATLDAILDFTEIIRPDPATQVIMDDPELVG